MEAKVEQAANEIKRPKACINNLIRVQGLDRLRSTFGVKRMSKSDLGLRRVAPAIWRYGLSVLLVALSTSVTILLQDYTFRTPLFFPAILLSTWFGGTGPGLLAVLLSTLSINYFILEPRFAFTPLSVRDAVHLAVFLFTALLISSWSTARRRVERALKHAHSELEVKVEERTAKLSRLNDELSSEIAERALTEDQLRQTEQRLRDLIANAPVILFALDGSGMVTLSEGKGLDTFGVKPGELVGQSIFDLYHDSPGLHSNARRALNGEAVTFITEANDESFEIHLIPLLNKSGKVAGVNGVTYNITDRQRTERELRLVIDTIPAMAWSTLPGGANDYCSKSWLEYTGMASGTELDYGWLDAFHPEDRAAHLAKWRAATETGKLLESVARIRGADGEYRWFLTQGVPLRDESGKIVRWYGTNVDIDERKRAESLLEGEKHLLEMIATGVALKEILTALCLTMEGYRNGTLASVLLLNQDGVHLDSVAGPSLPDGWTKQMEKLPIGPCAGSCGTAAYRGSPVIVSDIATDPLWDVPEHRTSALRHRLRASWSSPILSSEGKVLGTFCMYYRTPRSPDSHDLGLIERATHLARVAIERDRAEVALRTSQQKYRDLINASPDAICVINADAKFVLVNPAGVKLAGLPEPELIGSSIADTYLEEERHLLEQRVEKLKAEGSFRFERKFLRKNGEVIPVEVSLSALRGRYYQAIIRDISHRKRREALLAGENKVLEMVAKGDSLANILDSLCLLVEEQSSGVLASILLMDANGKQLRHGAAPNLPKAYTEAIDGTFIGPAVASCGTAAYRAEQVIVSDIATDPSWDAFRDLALSHSLLACWSTPIFSSEGKVIGTFAMYYREPRSPSPLEQDTIRHITHLAGVAIQRKLAETARRESEAYLAEAQRLSHTGSWAWTPATGEIRYWSEEAYGLLGFDPEAGPPRFEKFFGRLHPEDQDRVRELFGIAIAEKADFETDYRIVHPSGALKHIHAVGHPVCDETGHLVEFVGTVIDITESKRSEEALRASEQVARGQVEALAQSLDVLATAPAPDKFVGQMLSTIGRLLKAQSVTLWLFDESTDSLVLHLMADGRKLAEPDPEHPFMKDPMSWKQNQMIQELLFTAGPVVCEDIETDPRVNGEWREYLKRKGGKRFLAVPILVRGQVRGFVGIRHADRAAYRPEEIELTQALAHQVMLAIQLNELADQGQRAAVFEERNRMARDIHDTLAQGFTGVIVQLEAAEDAISCGCRKEADDHLHRAGELARRSLTEARRSVHALRPQALEEHNFWDALKGIIKNTTFGTALHTKFEAQGKLPKLPSPWQENLLHIGQEALTNTLKYARARNFETRLSYKANELFLELRDDGDGFKVKERHDGVGLTGMRERVEQMGGELKITSSRGKGTKITVVLPCNGESTT
jgi:PAS domain S-box-containing protein